MLTASAMRIRTRAGDVCDSASAVLGPRGRGRLRRRRARRRLARMGARMAAYTDPMISTSSASAQRIPIANPFRRNVAIVAHVDHGKTTLVDAMFRQAGVFRANERVAERALDTNELERERGITILAKNTAVRYKDIVINIVDTWGTRISGEKLNACSRWSTGSSCWSMPPRARCRRRATSSGRLRTCCRRLSSSTRSIALTRPREVLNEIYDLFIDLDATEDQIELPVRTSGRAGTATGDL